jgi:hypothetical protein
MALKLNAFVAAAAVAFSAAAAAQTTPPTEPTTGRTTAPGQTGTTPGQMQTTPGDASQMTPAATDQTPPTSAAATTAATAADVKKGSVVYDQSGGMVGKIESVRGKDAVLSTGTTRATVPISSFAKNDKGLVIGMTKAEIDAQAKKSAPKPK